MGRVARASRLLLPGLALAAALAAGAAWARVGGGESFSPGDSGSDDAGGIILELLFEVLWWLVWTHPVVGVPLTLAVVGGVVWLRWREGSGSTRRSIALAEAAARTQVDVGQVDGWVKALQAKDPSFQLLPFLDRVQRIFLAVQEAWFQCDLDPVRAYMSDATFQRLRTQLRLMDELGERDAIAGMKVLDLTLIGLERSEGFDSLHVRVRAEARDARAPARATDDEARAIAAKAPVEPFIEVWSFLRRPGAATRPDADLTQGKCPQCGAPFAGGATNQCTHCKALVNSGTYDWTLAEMTQGVVHVPREAVPQGVARLRQTDPAFHLEGLEDRASLCFWRWVEAQALGDASRLARVAKADLAARIGSDAQRQRRLFVECAVGAVHTLGIEALDGVDVAHVEVRWSARRGSPDTKRVGPVVPERWVFSLERASGVKTDALTGLASARCATCAAPLGDSGAPACEYCGTLLGAPERDWVLRDAVRWEAWAPAAQRKAAPAASREERERLLYVLAALAAADGTVDARERKLLEASARRWGIPPAQLAAALEAGPALFDQHLPRSPVEARAFLGELVAMALVDGRVDRKERRLLEAAAAHVGHPELVAELLAR